MAEPKKIQCEECDNQAELIVLLGYYEPSEVAFCKKCLTRVNPQLLLPWVPNETD